MAVYKEVVIGYNGRRERKLPMFYSGHTSPAKIKLRGKLAVNKDTNMISVAPKHYALFYIFPHGHTDKTESWYAGKAN